MDLTLERHKQTAIHTLSRIYPTSGRKLFCLDVVEPPILGFDRDLATLNPGSYKLFLKPDRTGLDLLAVLQKVRGMPRYGFVRQMTSVPMTELDFNMGNKYFAVGLRMGKIIGNTLHPNHDAYNKFMMALILAKQAKEIIYLNII